MADAIRIDAGEVSALAARIERAIVRTNAAVAPIVKKGAQNIKNDVRKDLATSRFPGIASIPIRYEIRSTLHVVQADVAPLRKTGGLANVAFFGTYKGGGGHRFYEHGEAEAERFFAYMRQAARDAW